MTYKRIKDNDIEDWQDTIFASGQCHMHAIAASNVHEGGTGSFYVVEDSEEIFWENDDGGVPAVVHVYSIHIHEGQVIARDVMGDRLLEDTLEEAADIFEILEPYGYETDLEGILSLSTQEDPDDDDCMPAMLAEFTSEDIEAIMKEETVTAEFATSPSPSL
jgi:hypothetical protein